jgi:hypothetical protein
VDITRDAPKPATEVSADPDTREGMPSGKSGRKITIKQQTQQKTKAALKVRAARKTIKIKKRGRKVLDRYGKELAREQEREKNMAEEEKKVDTRI